MNVRHLLFISCACALGASGCFRNDTSCASEADCFSPQVCQSGSCVVFVSPDVGTPDVGTPDVGTPDVDAPDVGTPDVGADAPDMGPDAPSWEVLAQENIFYPVRSLLQPNGDLMVTYAEAGAGTLEFVSRRADGMLRTLPSVDTESQTLGSFDLFEGEGGSLELLYTNDTSDMIRMTRPKDAPTWSSRPFIPSTVTRYTSLTMGLRRVDGRIMGVFVELGADEQSEPSGQRAVLFDEDTFASNGVLAVGARSYDSAIWSAVNVARSDGSLVSVWHTDMSTVMFTEVNPPAAPITKELDRGSGTSDLYEHGKMIRATRDDEDKVWVAYVFGDDTVGFAIRVRVIEPGGEILSPYPDLLLGEGWGVEDFDIVSSEGNAHLVLQKSRLFIQSSRVELASYSGAAWDERTLDPMTWGARFVRAHAAEGGAHIVYAAHHETEPIKTQVRYQWVDF